MEVIEDFRDLCISRFGQEIAPKLDLALEIASKALESKKRYNGDPFLYHSIGVATILITELQLGLTSVFSAILHDVVRLDPTTIPSIEAQFGPKVKETLLGMNNISAVETNKNFKQVNDFKELIVSYSTNPRIILLKIADRLEVMQSIDAFPLEKQEKKAWESLHLYAQIAHKLGLYGIKTELEEIALKYLEPEEYAHIAHKLKENEAAQADFIENFSAPIVEKLKANGLDFVLKGRTKSIYSIWKKMKKQKIAFEEVYDISAIRIIIDTPKENEKAACWLCYSIVTDFYKPNPDRMRDWISIPKSNGYESLHTTVVADNGKWVEVQIRSKRMDEIAEYGIAAHWKYKGVADNKEWLQRLREVIESVKIEGDTLVFDSEIDTSTKEVFVFTPNGDIKKLPLGSTVLDFAYSIHSNMGNQCIGGKINNKAVTIREVLKNGDLVEIKTLKTQVPRADWLNTVITSKAKARIKAFLREQELKETQVIKDELERKIKNWKLAISLDEAVNILSRYYKVKNGAELYQQLESGEISMLETKDIISRFINGELTLRTTEERHPKEKAPAKNPKDDILIVDNNISGLKYNFAKCCNPIYGDSIGGFITVLNGITIHQSDCVNYQNLKERYPYRTLEARWSSERKGGAFMAKIAVYSRTNIGLEENIRKIIHDLNIFLRSIETTEQGYETTTGDSAANAAQDTRKKLPKYYTVVQMEVENHNVLHSAELLFNNIEGVTRAYRL